MLFQRIVKLVSSVYVGVCEAVYMFQKLENSYSAELHGPTFWTSLSLSLSASLFCTP